MENAYVCSALGKRLLQFQINANPLTLRPSPIIRAQSFSATSALPPALNSAIRNPQFLKRVPPRTPREDFLLWFLPRLRVKIGAFPLCK
jgi:hypothetical protein